MNRKIVLISALLFPVPQVSAESAPTEGYELSPHPTAMYEPWTPNGSSQIMRDVPPPPPGPYFSTALSDLEPHFNHEKTPDQASLDSMREKSMVRPDAPWPSKHVRPKRWMPEEGYHFAPEQPRYQRAPRLRRSAPYGMMPYYPGFQRGPEYQQAPQYHQPPRMNSEPAWEAPNFPVSRFPSRNRQQN